MPMGMKKSRASDSESNVSAGWEHADESALRSAAALSSESESNNGVLPDWAASAPKESGDDMPAPSFEETADEDLPPTPPCEQEDVHDYDPPPPEQVAAALAQHVTDPQPHSDAKEVEYMDEDEEVEGAEQSGMTGAAIDEGDGLDDMTAPSVGEETAPSAQNDPDWEPSHESASPTRAASPEVLDTEPTKPTRKPRWAAPKKKDAPTSLPAAAPSLRTPAATKKKRTVAMSSSSGESLESSLPAAPDVMMASVATGDGEADEDDDADDDSGKVADVQTPVTTTKPSGKHGKKPKDGKTKDGKTKDGAKSKKAKNTAPAAVDGVGGSKVGKPKAGKKEKDPNAPKRAAPAYQIWAAEARKAAPFNALSFVDASKALSAAWKEVTAEEKAPFEQQAAEDKKRYEREMKAYTPTPKPPKASKPKLKLKANESGKKRVAKKKTYDEGTAATDDAEERTSSDEDEDVTGDNEGTLTIYRGPSTLVDPRRIAPPSAQPLYDDVAFEPRATQPMRVDKFKVGDEVAWVPQALVQFLQAHDALMQAHGHKLLGSALPLATSRLMLKPADHTANSAKVTRVTKTSVPGLSVLHLVATSTLRATKTAGASARGGGDVSGAESGFESVVSESDVEGTANSAACDAEYSLPVLARAFCDVDAHVLHLKTYLDALRRCEASSHVCVPFASAADSTSLTQPTEDLWEGRAFDNTIVHDPDNYPRSLYKSLHVVWYRCLERNKKANRLCEQWAFDSEQTDNFVSPWDTQTSTVHSTWRRKYPDLANLYKPRTRRGVFKTNALVEAPESMDIGQMEAEADDVEHEAITRVLKRLLSNEAAPLFFHPVPDDEVEYHKTVQSPICLADILTKHEAGGYDSYLAFATDLESMISNSFYFNEDESIPWIGTCMLQADYTAARNELKAKGLEALLAGPSGATGQVLALVDPTGGDVGDTAIAGEDGNDSDA